jgi:hypothetical protein
MATASAPIVGVVATAGSVSRGTDNMPYSIILCVIGDATSPSSTVPITYSPIVAHQ